MTIPSLPDNWNRVLMVLGLVVISVCGWVFYQMSDNISPKEAYINGKLDSLTAALERITNSRPIRDDMMMALFVRKATNKPDTIKNEETQTLIFKYRKLTTPELEDSIDRMFIIHDKQLAEFIIVTKTVKRYSERLDEQRDFFLICTICLLIGIGLGIIFIVIGLFNGLDEQSIKDRSARWQLIESNAYLAFDNCQSCGRKFGPMVEYGTRANGKIHGAFCINCYYHGKFNEPNLTLEDIKLRTSAEIKHISPKKQKRMILNLTKLERWAKSRY